MHVPGARAEVRGWRLRGEGRLRVLLHVRAAARRRVQRS